MSYDDTETSEFLNDLREVSRLMGEDVQVIANDSAFPHSSLDIEVEGTWVPTSAVIWKAWTGRRRVWSVEYHGPIYAFGGVEDEKPYTGKRVCSCKECQRHVSSYLRPN